MHDYWPIRIGRRVAALACALVALLWLVSVTTPRTVKFFALEYGGVALRDAASTASYAFCSDPIPVPYVQPRNITFAQRMGIWLPYIETAIDDVKIIAIGVPFWVLAVPCAMMLLAYRIIGKFPGRPRLPCTTTRSPTIHDSSERVTELLRVGIIHLSMLAAVLCAVGLMVGYPSRGVKLAHGRPIELQFVGQRVTMRIPYGEKDEKVAFAVVDAGLFEAGCTARHDAEWKSTQFERGIGGFSVSRRRSILSGAFYLAAGAKLKDHEWTTSATMPIAWMLAFFSAYPVYAMFCGPVRRWRRFRRGCCTGCGYDLTKAESDFCTECGATQSTR